MTVPSTVPKEDFRHKTLFYGTAGEYLADCLEFVRGGLAAGEPVLVAVPQANLSPLRSRLGEAAEAVSFVDMTVAGGNPGRIISSVLRPFFDEHPARPVRVISEAIWPGRTAMEYPACIQHEALVNLAFTGRQASMLCPYNAVSLPPSVLTDAARTHPVIVQGGRPNFSSTYGDPVQVLDAYNRPLPEPPVVGDTILIDAAATPRTIRRFVHGCARSAGMIPEQLTKLLAAVDEVVTNTIVHTRRPGILSIWQEGDWIACEVEDSGHILDPLVGRRPSAPFDIRPRGLALVQDVCDLVRMHSDETGTTIRIWVRLHDGPPTPLGAVPQRHAHPGRADQRGVEELDRAQVFLRIDDAGEVGVDEPATEALLPSIASSPVFDERQWALHTNGDADYAPASNQHVRHEQGAPPPGQKAAAGQEQQEREVRHHGRFSEHPIAHRDHLPD